MYRLSILFRYIHSCILLGLWHHYVIALICSLFVCISSCLILSHHFIYFNILVAYRTLHFWKSLIFKMVIANNYSAAALWELSLWIWVCLAEHYTNGLLRFYFERYNRDVFLLFDLALFCVSWQWQQLPGSMSPPHTGINQSSKTLVKQASYFV